jgi:hypothetical protein
MSEYQRFDTGLSLADGLAEYYSTQPGLSGGRGLSDAAREFFRCHDAAHVVFGCSTELVDEGIVKVWSLLGTTAGLGLLRDYRLPESREIYRKLGIGEVVATAIRSVAFVPLTAWRCSQMKKRWPWHDFDEYQAAPLVDIRTEFGIRVVSGTLRERRVGGA